jgi:hypothetical protein
MPFPGQPSVLRESVVFWSIAYALQEALSGVPAASANRRWPAAGRLRANIVEKVSLGCRTKFLEPLVRFARGDVSLFVHISLHRYRLQKR